jgi:hypothetical protein
LLYETELTTYTNDRHDIFLFTYSHLNYYFSSFISVLADGEAIADELNPLTISHTARTISFTTIGTAKRTVDGGIRPGKAGTSPLSMANLREECRNRSVKF